MKIRTFLIVLLVVLLLAACVAPFSMTIGSGNPVSSEYDLRGFTGVHASSAFRVSITQGEDFKVIVTVDDTVVDNVDVELRDKDLYVGMKGQMMLGNGAYLAEVTMPRLEEVEMSGASTAHIAGFDAVDEFRGRASGASRLTGEVIAGAAYLDAEGASNISLTGSAETMQLTLSGASKAALGDFTTVDAEVDLSGASSAEVTATGSLEGSASGSSRIRYGGDPQRVRVATSGASSVDER